nr:hypothetical protein [uncultured Flavobacterium sp.]
MKKLFFTAICAMAFSNGFAQSGGINWECVSIAAESAQANKDSNPKLTDAQLVAIYNQTYNTCVKSGSNTVIVVGPVDKGISKN